MGVSNFGASDPCPWSYVQMWSFDRTIAARVPVIQQDFSSIEVVNLVGVTADGYVPGRTLVRAVRDEVLTECDLKTRGALKEHRVPVVYSRVMRNLVSVGNDD